MSDEGVFAYDLVQYNRQAVQGERPIQRAHLTQIAGKQG